MDTFIEKLTQRLQEPLPGPEAQYRLAHAVRRPLGPPPPDARQASVLDLFYPKADEWNLVLIERTSSHPDDRHGGQIGFPGGRVEPEDPSLGHAALREAEEEVGAPAHDIRLLGRLTELYIPVSNYLVHPFVGWLDYAPDFRRQVTEVAAILEVPYASFQDLSNLRKTDLQITPSIRLREVPFFAVQQKIVWGATAMMIGELLALSEGEGHFPD
ncbi:MAG: CoA pyrophosphatase [Lewinella sp.]|nr:CoA pyrophosphatase [Lewinella sp.]